MSRQYLHILGVPNFANYESGTCLMRVPVDGGRIEYVCIGEDRITRVKHTYMFAAKNLHTDMGTVFQKADH